MNKNKYWKLNIKNFILFCEFYEIPLEQCNSGAEISDWIFQVTKKTWCTDQILAELVRSLNEILDPQQNFCSWGENKIVPENKMEALLSLKTRYGLKKEGGEE